MKTLLKFALLLIASAPLLAQTTYYVRSDGGTRFSANITSGQCDGKHDAAYSGTGTNQACAFNQAQYLYQDGSFYNGSQAFPAWGWVTAPGDTAIIRGCLGGTPCRFAGWPNITSCSNGVQNFGNCGDPEGGPPVMPSGINPSNPTRILGQNFGSCTSTASRTKLIGGFGVFALMAFTGDSTDVECFDMSDQSACNLTNTPGVTQCEVSGVIQTDFARYGLYFVSGVPTNVTIKDINLHGFALAGIFGSPGTGFNATDLQIVGNAYAGWNGDDSSGNTGSGTMSTTNFLVYGNGCVEEYPLVWPAANSLGGCSDQGSGGYGDGWGTATVPSSPAWQVTWNDGTVAFNTQDGLDGLHVSGTGAIVTETRTKAFGNEGQQMKIGGAAGVIQNSIVIGNCQAMVPWNISGFSITSGVATITTTNTAISGYAMNVPTPVLIQGLSTGTYLNGLSVTATPISSNQFTFSVSHANVSFTSDTGVALTQIAGFTSDAFAQLNTQCRAGDTAVLINVTPGVPSQFQDNTVFSDGSIAVETEYAAGTGSTNTLLFNNNVFVGFNNFGTGQFPTPIFSTTDLNMLTNPGASWTNNATYHQRSSWTCPNPGGESAALCTFPQLTDMTFHPIGFGDVSPTFGAAVLGFGTPIVGITGDFLNNLRDDTHPTTGACELVGDACPGVSAPSVVADPTCTPAAGSFGSVQSVTCTSSTGGSTTVCTIDGSTPNHSSPTCTAISIGAGVTTLKALSFEATFTDSSIVPFVYTITLPSGGIVNSGTVSVGGFTR